MGAGKGKTRRTQAAASVNSRGILVAPKTIKGIVVQSNENSWSEWLRQTGVANVSLGGYYLNKENSDKKALSEDEKLFILREFLADAVSAGALIFNEPAIDPKDFCVKFDTNTTKYGYTINTMVLEYAPQGKTIASGSTVFHEWYLASHKKMYQASDLIRYILNALQEATK